MRCKPMTNLQVFFLSSSVDIVYHMLGNVEKEKLVIDLYYNQRKNVRQIAQEARMSFRDIASDRLILH